MFVNEEVSEIVLIISGSTEYEFSAAIFIELSKFWCEVFPIIMECSACVYKQAKEW